jgi:hypothetical protein
VGLQATRGTESDGPGRRGPGKLKGNDSRWHCDNSIANDHQHRGQDAPGYGLGRDVSVAHCSHRDDRPIHSSGNTGEAIRLSLYLIHQRADNDDDGEDRKKKDDYLTNTLLQGDTQNGGFADVFG